MVRQRITRREFLKIGCGAALASMAACSGLGVLATRAPEISYLETRAEGAMAMKKILVTYATRAGSTIQVAETIAQTLTAAGGVVAVRPIKSVTDLKGYDAVVIGSAIRMGQWLPEAAQFVKNHQPTLASVPTAYFLVSGYMRTDTPEMRKTVEAYLDPVRKILEPKSTGIFAGKMDYGKLSFLDRTLAKAMKEEEGDWRNWDAIRSWARELLPIFALA